MLNSYSRNGHKLINILPKWQNFAKSGHTSRSWSHIFALKIIAIRVLISNPQNLIYFLKCKWVHLKSKKSIHLFGLGAKERNCVYVRPAWIIMCWFKIKLDKGTINSGRWYLYCGRLCINIMLLRQLWAIHKSLLKWK